MTIPSRQRGRPRQPITRWIPACHLNDLEIERGRAALVAGRQVALFRLSDREVVAVDHRDPFSGTNVLANGIVGAVGDVVKVISPMYSQAFDLRTGCCLDAPDVHIDCYAVRIVDDTVEVRAA